MMKQIIQSVTKKLPLMIESIDWDDPILTLAGKDWNFSTRSSWRICNENVLVVGCYDSEATKIINTIKNCQITSVEIQGKYSKFDPVFRLSNGLLIEFFSTTYYEPWTFDFSSGIVYVASPADPALIDE